MSDKPWEEYTEEEKLDYFIEVESKTHFYDVDDDEE